MNKEKFATKELGTIQPQQEQQDTEAAGELKTIQNTEKQAKNNNRGKYREKCKGFIRTLISLVVYSTLLNYID